MSQKCIVQFVWDGGNDDYLSYRNMTPEQIEEVSALLEKANALGIIRGGWYVGPLAESEEPYDVYLTALKDSLRLEDECCCVPTLDEVHPECPLHGDSDV